MGLKLKPSQGKLLAEVISKRSPHLMRLVSSQEKELTNDQRDELREALADEFVESGLKADDEPNERGLLLEDLIGRLRNP